ncbi:MAG: hypothetical protein QOH22_2102 [Gemmatimonadaceae bacterium]|nr:hypothetical protein [Gemmatimonadaceae bacterium]
MYKHTQVGYLVLVVMLVAALGIFGLAPRGPLPVTLIVAVLLFISAVLFSSLTVEISDGELRFHFGPGFWRKRYPLAEVADAEVAQSSWWEGWGIRVTPRGMLYNVSGTGAVEIKLRSGRRLRIGTDEPEVLVQAIRAAIIAPRQS